MSPFDEVQQLLGEVLPYNAPGRPEPHVLVVLPSFSAGSALLAHYGTRLPALEHRYLVSIFLLHRIPNCELVYVSTTHPGPVVMDYYLRLLPRSARADVLSRFHHVAVEDRSARSVASKLLDRPDLIARIRKRIAGRPALLEPWNVTQDEADLAVALGVPVNGSDPRLWPLGFKSAGRRLFREAGVPVAAGFEDIHGVEAAADAILALATREPRAEGVLLKLDESGSGDGNVVLRTADVAGRADLVRRLQALPDWYREELEKGAVVEALIAGERFSSPSVQVDIRPDGKIDVLATHEQLLGGENGQVYMGCRFPADPAYAAELAEHGRRTGSALARAGALGRFAVDFAVASTGRDRTTAALEINLRKGGTSHPYSCLRNLVPGFYDAAGGVWRADAGGLRCYVANDNLMDPAWTGRSPAEVIAAVEAAGLEFSHAAGRGTVLMMLSGLEIDGRLGYCAIGRDAGEAQDLADRLEDVVRV